ncbi:MAG: hypothetical protein OXI81_04280 [Paracoccaceae bacterium]|nr:hypothetical protein [Paracoccaceae bacterium]
MSIESELGLRPIWHWQGDRIGAHPFLSVLAYHANRLIRTPLKGDGLSLAWLWITATIGRTKGDPEVVRQHVSPPAAAEVLAR